MLAALSLCFAFAAPPSIEGTLTVGGKDIALKHVYALYHDNEDDVLLDGPELRLLFADREMDPAVLQSPALLDLQMQARDGKLQGVIFTFDPKAETRDVHETILYKSDDPNAMMPSMNHSGNDVVFSNLKLSDTEISATAADEAEEDSFSGPFKFSAKFSAPIDKLPPVTERWEGVTARNSAPAKVFLDLEEAVRSADFAAAEKFGGASRIAQMKQFMEQMGKEAFIEQAKQFIPDRATRTSQITSVIVRGKRAVLLADEGNGIVTIPFVLEGSQWKIE